MLNESVDIQNLKEEKNISKETLEKLNKDQEEVVSNILTETTNLTEKLNSFIKKVENVSFDKNGFVGSVNDFLSGMSTLEISAITHISGAIFILFALFTIICIIYGDMLIIHFKLEERFPKLARFIRLRRKFQQFYLFLNFSLIIVVLFVIIFINLSIFFLNLFILILPSRTCLFIFTSPL